MFNQNRLRQIFINKDSSLIQSFKNNRPITISSMFYKIIEIIVLKKMKQEKKDANITDIDKNQIGF